LQGKAIELTSAVGIELIRDCTRAGEQVISDADLCEKWDLTHADLESLSKNKSFAKAVRAESQRRINLGICVREKAARHLVKVPDVLDSIVSDVAASPRHRIESARELRATASNVAENEHATASNEKFVITINLGADHIEHYALPKTVKPALPAKEVKIIEEGDIGW
jgi:hypothetical protein